MPCPLAKLVNLMTYVSKDVPPLLVVQGANDNTEPFADSMRLVANLMAVGVDASIIWFPARVTDTATHWLTAKGIGK